MIGSESCTDNAAPSDTPCSRSTLLQTAVLPATASHLLIWRRSKLHLSCCDCRACHFLKRFLVYAWPGLNPRALFGDRRKLDGVAKGRDDRFTHLVNGEIAHDDALLVLKGTHWFLLFGASSPAICITKCLLIRLVPWSRSAAPSWR